MADEPFPVMTQAAATPQPEAAEPVEIIDPLDEVLQQTSEHTLRIAHVDEAVKEVAKTVSDLSEIVNAGLSEIRAGVMQVQETQAAGAAGGSAAATPASADAEAFRQSVLERLDELEQKAGRAASRHVLTQMLLLLSLAALGVMLAMSLGVLKLPGIAGSATAAATAAAPAPAAATPAAAVPAAATAPVTAGPAMKPADEPAVPATPDAKAGAKHQKKKKGR